MLLVHRRTLLAIALATSGLGLGCGLLADAAEAGGGRKSKGARVAGFMQAASSGRAAYDDLGLKPRTVFGSTAEVHGRTVADRYFRQVGYLRP